MNPLQTVIKKIDHGRSDFSIMVELVAGALFLGLAMRWLEL